MSPAARGRAALFCAVFSLGWGTAIFLLWTVTHWPLLEQLGALWILGGTLMVLVGLGFLFMARLGRDAVSGRRTLLTLALLLANFPAAVGILTLASQLKHPWIDVDVADVTRSEDLRVDSIDPHPNVLEIQVIGALDGRARVGLYPASLKPEGLVEIGPGEVRRLVYGGDYYTAQASIHYQPVDVRGGRLRLRCRFR